MVAVVRPVSEVVDSLGGVATAMSVMVIVAVVAVVVAEIPGLSSGDESSGKCKLVHNDSYLYFVII